MKMNPQPSFIKPSERYEDFTKVKSVDVTEWTKLDYEVWLTENRNVLMHLGVKVYQAAYDAID